MQRVRIDEKCRLRETPHDGRDVAAPGGLPGAGHVLAPLVRPPASSQNQVPGGFMAQTMHERPFAGPQTDKVTGAPPRAADNSASESPTLMLLVMLATAGVLLYAIFLLNPANRGDWLPWFMVIAAETVLVLQAILSMWTVLSSGHNPRN